MAPLRQATEARLRSAELRRESTALRFVVRRTLGETEEQLARSSTTYRAARGRRTVVPSPWSPLLWRLPDRELTHVIEGL